MEITEKLEQLRIKRAAKKVLEEHTAELQGEVLIEWPDEVNKLGKKQPATSMKYPVDDGRVTATRVARTKLVIDSQGLKKAIGAKAYDKMTSKSLDEDKVAIAMADGELDPVVVAKYSEEVPAARPYITFTFRSKAK